MNYKSLAILFILLTINSLNVLSECENSSIAFFCEDTNITCNVYQCKELGVSNRLITSAKDTTVDSLDQETDKSTAIYIDVGHTIKSKRDSLIEFNLSSIKQEIIVNSAALYLNVYESAGKGAVELEIYQINESWKENTTWSNAPTNFQTKTNTTINLSMAPYWKEINLTSIVKNWIEKNQENFGVLITSKNTSTNRYARISSKEHIAFEPLLIIKYEAIQQEIPVISKLEEKKEITKPTTSFGSGRGGYEEPVLIELEKDTFLSDIGELVEKPLNLTQKLEEIENKNISLTQKALYKNIVNLQDKGLLIKADDANEENYEIKKNVFIGQVLIYFLIFLSAVSLAVSFSIVKANKTRVDLMEKQRVKNESLRKIFDLIIKLKRKGASKDEIIQFIEQNIWLDQDVTKILNKKFRYKTWAGWQTKKLSGFIDEPISFEQKKDK